MKQPIGVINSCMRLLSDCTLNKLTAIPKRYETFLLPWLCKDIIYHSQLKPNYLCDYICSMTVCAVIHYPPSTNCAVLFQMSQKPDIASTAQKFHIHDCPVLV